MEEKNINTTFSDLINERIGQGMKSANRIIVNSLKDKSIPISIRTMQTYRKGTRVPSYLIAKEIVDFLDINLSDEELKDILNYSRSLTNYENVESAVSPSSFDRNDNSAQQTHKSKIKVTIDMNQIDIAADLNFKKDILYERVVNLFGDDVNFNEYVMYLINKDLTESNQ